MARKARSNGPQREGGRLRYVSWIISLLFAVVLILFAVSNRETVAVSLWPFFQQGLEMPVFLAVLVPLALAFLVGWLAAWWRAGHHRRESRKRADRIDRLAAEVRRLRAKQDEIDDSQRRAAEGARLDAASKAARSAAEQELPTKAEAVGITPAGRPPAAIESRPH
jgi:uncharacterized integral membrane protein